MQRKGSYQTLVTPVTPVTSSEDIGHPAVRDSRPMVHPTFMISDVLCKAVSLDAYVKPYRLGHRVLKPFGYVPATKFFVSNRHSSCPPRLQGVIVDHLTTCLQVCSDAGFGERSFCQPIITVHSDAVRSGTNVGLAMEISRSHTRSQHR